MLFMVAKEFLGHSGYCHGVASVLLEGVFKVRVSRAMFGGCKCILGGCQRVAMALLIGC